MITYNHEKYIEQAVRSVMMQETDFNYELVIGEDCSTDKTRDILLRLKKEFPNKIRLKLREKNLGMIPNLVATYNECDGEYIALCEGDDFWIDELKLTKQVRFLDRNPEYVLVGTNAIRLCQTDNIPEGLMYPKLEAFDFDTAFLMKNNPLPTLTAVFRNHLVTNFPDIYWTGSGGDRRLYILLSRFGKCRYLPEVTGVYRVHSTSVTQNRPNSYKERIKCLKEVRDRAMQWNTYLDNQYTTEVNDIQEQVSRKIFRLALGHMDLFEAIAVASDIDVTKLGRRGTIVHTLLVSLQKILR